VSFANEWTRIEEGAYMDMQRSKVPPERLLLLDADVLEVLIAEDDDTALSDEECEFVLLEIVELGELQAADLGADDGGELCHLQVCVVLGEEVGLDLVGDQTAIVELKGLQGWEMRIFVVDREIVRVFVL